MAVDDQQPLFEPGGEVTEMAKGPGREDSLSLSPAPKAARVPAAAAAPVSAPEPALATPEDAGTPGADAPVEKSDAVPTPQVVPPKVDKAAQGQLEEQILRQGGASDDDIMHWKTETSQILRDGGATPDDVNQYFGVKPFDPTPSKNLVTQNLQAVATTKPKREPIDTSIQPVEAEDFADQITAGWQMSVLGLATGGKPQVILPRNADIAANLAAMVPQLAGDAIVSLPAMIAASAAAAPLGPRAALSAGGGAMQAVPNAIRKMYMDHYDRGDIQDSREFATRFAATSWEAVKQFAIGASTMGVGSVVAGDLAAPAISKVIGTGMASQVAKSTAELATMTAAADVLDWHLPSVKEIALNTLAIGGMHAGVEIIKGGFTASAKVQAMYAEHGISPSELAEAAQSEPALKQDLVLQDRTPPGLTHPSEEAAAASKDFTPEQQAQIDKIDRGIKTLQGLPNTPENMDLYEQMINHRDELINQAIEEQKTIENSKENVGDAAAAEGVLTAPEGPLAAEGEGGLADDTPATENALKPIEENPQPGTIEADRKLMLDQIGEQTKAPDKSVAERITEFRAKVFDRFDPLKKAGAQAAYEAARKYQDNQSKVYGFVHQATRDFHTGEINGEGLAPILQEAEKATNDPGGQKLMAYLMAKRGLELDRRGIESLFQTKEHAKAAERIVADGAKEFEPFAKRVHDFENRVVDYWADSGMASKEMVASMKGENQAHIPLQIVKEIDAMTGKLGSGASSRGQIHKIVGNLAMKVNPLESMLQNTQALIQMADRNRINQLTVEKLDGLALRRVEPSMKKVSVGAEELGKLTGHDPGMFDDHIDIFRPESPRQTGNTISLRRDGKLEVYEGNAGVIEALKSLDGSARNTSVFNKILRPFAQTVRMGNVELNPFFGIKHIWRNQLSAGVYSQTSMIPFLHPISYLGEFLKGEDSEAVRNFFHDGAGVSSIDRMSKDYLEKDIFEGKKNADGTYDFKDPDIVDKSWNVVKKLPDLFHLQSKLISSSDNLLRFTEYQRKIERGATREEAATAAREVAPDYQTKGSINNVMVDNTAFFNIHMQVMDRFFQGATGDDKLGVFARMVAQTTVPAIVLWAATHDDTRIEALPAWRKATMFNFPITWNREARPGEDLSSIAKDLISVKDGKTYVNDGPVLSLPVPGLGGMIGGTLVTGILDSLAKHNPKAALNVALAILEEPFRAPIANAVQPMGEQISNRSWFTGSNIVPQSQLRDLPADQHNYYTSEVAKQISKVVGFIPGIREIGPGNIKLESPEVIDNYIQGWFGTGGRAVVDVVDKILHANGIGEDKILPTKSYTELPGIKTLFVQYPSPRTENIDTFDERNSKAQMIIQSLKEAAKSKDQARYKEIMATYGSEMKQLGEAAGALKMMRKTLTAIRVDNSMKSDDKAQLNKAIWYRMDQVSTNGNKTLDAIKKAVQNKPEENN